MQENNTAHSSNAKGTALLLASAVGFALLYYLTPNLTALGPVLITAFRVLLGTLALLVFFAATKNLRLIIDTFKHLTAKPLRLLVMLVLGFILASQLWLFAYGPITGRALQVSLGYFLMPLVLVLIGRFLYKDQLAWWHWLAVIVSTTGVVYEIVRTGSFAWEVLWVALMYPIYFVLRRAIGTAHLGGMFWEMAFISPICLVALIYLAPQNKHLTAHPQIWLAALGIGLLGSVSLIVWILAAKHLSLSLFGLLSYIEPGFLMLSAVLLGEAITPGEIPLYIAVWSAGVIVVIGGTVTVLKSRKAKKLAAKSAQQIEPEQTAATFEAVQPEASAEQQMLVVAATGSIPIIDVATEADHRQS